MSAPADVNANMTPGAVMGKRPPDHLFKLVTNAWTRPFWDAAAEHRLVAPRCADCARFRMPPTSFCPHCHSQRIEWVTLNGDGNLYSYSVVHRAIFPGMEHSIPYVTAVVSLPDADGVRMISNVVDTPLDALAVGAPLRVVFDDLPGGATVPRFTMAGVRR